MESIKVTDVRVARIAAPFTVNVRHGGPQFVGYLLRGIGKTDGVAEAFTHF